MTSKNRAKRRKSKARVIIEKAYASRSETLEDFYLQALRRLQLQIKPSVFKSKKGKAISK